MKLNRKVIIGSAMAVLMTASVASQAAMIKQSEQGDSVSVSVAELNLNSVQGQEVAYKRLKNAAQEVCGSNFAREAGGIGRAKGNQTCYDETLSDAVETLNHSGIKAMHASS